MVHFAEGLVYLTGLAVKPEHRGQSVASELLGAIMEKAGQYNMYMRCPLPFELYFDKMGTFPARSQIVLGRHDPVVLSPEDLAVGTARGVTVVNFNTESFLGDLVQYDMDVMTLDRSTQLEDKTSDPNTVTKIALGREGNVVGFCTVQEATDGSWCFEQFSAESRHIAKMLIRGFVDDCPRALEVGVVLDSPLWPDEERSFLKSLGWKVKTRAVCRFSIYEVKFDYSRIFSL